MTRLAFDRCRFQDAEARISLLRERAGIGGKKKSRREEEREQEEAILSRSTFAEPAKDSTPTLELSDSKHINLFEDLEQV